MLYVKSRRYRRTTGSPRVQNLATKLRIVFDKEGDERERVKKETRRKKERKEKKTNETLHREINSRFLRRSNLE